MTLPSELVSELIEVTSDQTETKHEATVHGTIVEHDDTKYVRLDGSDLLTPISTTVDAKDGERVTVLIKDHKATVTGNTTAPAARDETVTDLGNQVNGRIDVEFAEIDTIVAGKIEAELADIDVVIAEKIDAELGNFDEIYVKEAEIDTLITDKVTAEVALLDFAKIEDLDATNARVYNLEVTYAEIDDLYAKKADIESLDAKYANIDFANVKEADIDNLLARSAIIEEVTSADGNFTRNLTAVTINGDLIEASTLKVDRLIVRGTDGNYYALSTDFSGIAGVEPVEEDAIHGSILIAESITADKISVTDLVAFGATIGGFHITSNSLYSGVKESVSNTTRGIYQDSDGQFAVGDASNYLKFYKDTDGKYKLAISAESLTFSSTGKNVEETIQDEVDKVEVGGRNHVTGSPTEWTDITIGDWSGKLYHTANGLNDYIHNCGDYGANIGDLVTFSIDLNAINKRLVLRVDQYNDAGSLIKKNFGNYIEIGEIGRSHLTLQVREDATHFYVYIGADGTVSGDTIEQYKCLKIEKGNKPTDWTPAPEDMATSADIENVSKANRDTNDEVARAHSLIQQLSDSISMLVTDENGTSLMTQTADGGWTFSMAQTNATVSDMSNQLAELQESTGSTQATVDTLQQAVDDIGATMEYVRIGTYEDEPCIELGESDSDFSLMITNTRIMFRVGSGVPTRITTDGLITQNIEVERTFKHGLWAWSERQNGNYGLQWRGTFLAITSHPSNTSKVTSSSIQVASFAITAVGEGVTYEWQYSNDSGSTWVDANNTDSMYMIVIGANSATFTRLVRCIVTDKFGHSLTSNTATLTVTKS